MQRNPWDLPSPPVRPVRGPRVWLWLAATIVGLILIAVAFFVPIPIFYSLLPGPVRDVGDLIEVEDAKTYVSDGRLYMTTVAVDLDVTFAQMVGAFFDPDSVIVFREQVTGGSSIAELEAQQLAEMRLSKQQAKVVALSALGIGRSSGKGARITDTVPGFPAAGRLQEGDVIVRVGDQDVSSSCDVGRILGDLEAGSEISIMVRRDGTERAVRLRVAESPSEPGHAFLGVGLSDVDLRFDTDLDVQFETDEVAGPSAGLMMAVGLYDKLTPGDITGGRRIAGSGTIGCDGKVGAIGGIEQKMAAVKDAGVDVFLVPKGNFPVAERLAGDLEVVSIGSFDDAVSYLEAAR